MQNVHQHCRVRQNEVGNSLGRPCDPGRRTVIDFISSLLRIVPGVFNFRVAHNIEIKHSPQQPTYTGAKIKKIRVVGR